MSVIEQPAVEGGEGGELASRVRSIRCRWCRGGLLVLASLVAYALRIGARGGISRLRRTAVGAGGFLMVASTALWAISPAAALVPAVLFAFAWLQLATAEAGVPSPAPADKTDAPR